MLFHKLLTYLTILRDWRKGRLIPSTLPVEVSIEATNVCNFRCAFCPQSDPQHHEFVPRTYLGLQDAETIVKNLRDAGIATPTLHWTLDGEPFMNKTFSALCEVAIRYGFKNMYFASNGMLLSEDTIAGLPRHDGARYTFTVDFCADEALFEDVRGTKGAWKRIYENIQSALRQNSLQHINFAISDITPYRTRDERVLKDEFQKLKNLFRGERSRITFRQRKFHNAAGLVQGVASTGLGKKYYGCPYPWTTLVIASDGAVVACCRDLRRQTVLGNALHRPLAEIWRGAAFQELRRNLVQRTPWKSAACKGCDMPYDSSRFSVSNILATLLGRLQLFKSR